MKYLLGLIVINSLHIFSISASVLDQDAGNNEHDYVQLAHQEQIIDVGEPEEEAEIDECCRELCREAQRNPAKIVCLFICATGFIGLYPLLFCLRESCGLPWEGMG